ncbi:hypothetical protein AB0K34_05050 [Actinomadura sp. NPDC049382]|uniref:hypothetical protein n=1 Tax=Actinomadura sp. NPDC049382 TaxID=3158220 RepID=UPI003432D0E2
MADTYWDHPARRETKRLLDLGDAGAILDELQNQTTEWDDAREALDHLVRGPRTESERLRAELDARTDERDDAMNGWKKAEAERDRLAEQVQRTEQAVHGFFADADQRGVHLDGMTVTELCDAVMAAIRKGAGR